MPSYYTIGNSVNDDTTEPVPKEVVETEPDTTVEDETEAQFEWYGEMVTMDQLDEKLASISKNNAINAGSSLSADQMSSSATSSVGGVFGMPYQFSDIVDMEFDTTNHVGRKFSEKILSVMPVLFLTPGEPLFMAGYGKEAKAGIVDSMLNTLGPNADNDNADADVGDGRYYSFNSNFPEFKKYANVALRALALYMGIENIIIPVPGKSGTTVKLASIDVEKFMNNDFTKIFGTNCTLPFFLDAETSISEEFGNETTESMLAQTVNGFSSTASEIQYIMGSKDEGGLVSSIGSAVSDAATGVTSALGDVAEVIAGKGMLTRVTNELTTIVSGGKIVFPEIWSDSSYGRSYSINLKLRSPDPDPVSIFLNIYMPIILLVSMTAPRQMNNSSNSFESPFLVRASYKSIFSCDLGLITSLSITKGGQDKWNVLGQPMVADVSITIKDLYQNMFISKRYGLITNTAQMDYLATMAGIDLNDYEPLRIVKLWSIIAGNTPRDFASDTWGGVKRALSQAANKVLGGVTDTRFLQ